MKRIALLSLTLLFAATVSLQAADATGNWKKHCAACHGNDGKGNTKAGRKAKVKDLSDAEHQKSFTDEKAAEAIKDGVKVDGKEVMKGYGDKLSADEIKDLVAFIRKFKS
ncbi:MAG: c-type cytochrome [Verrucomicrobia bacterium]|nr:c-type cytochrome [Verrucomicrobiota bacterium]